MNRTTRAGERKQAILLTVILLVTMVAVIIVWQQMPDYPIIRWLSLMLPFGAFCFLADAYKWRAEGAIGAIGWSIIFGLCYEKQPEPGTIPLAAALIGFFVLYQLLAILPAGKSKTA